MITENINLKIATEKIIDLIDEMGFTTAHPIDVKSLRDRITCIIRENLLIQGVNIYSTTEE
jgi:hypothetical protein